MAYDVASFEANGDIMEVKATAKALMNTTDVVSGSGMSPVLATLLTTVSAAY
jgi:hypothetical protein